MAKDSKNQTKKSKKGKVDPNSPWIKMRTGLIVITIVSLGMAIFIGWPSYQAMGAEGILYGLGFGAAIWVIFLGALYFNRLFRGNR